MRIVAGRFRGKQLKSPKDTSIRPTSDRVRESVFNMLASRLGPDLAGHRVLDLFAGTGALGLEALSRGASYAVFVDTGTEARGLIRDHIEAFGLGGQTKLLRRDATALGPSSASGPSIWFSSIRPMARASAKRRSSAPDKAAGWRRAPRSYWEETGMPGLPPAEGFEG